MRVAGAAEVDQRDFGMAFQPMNKAELHCHIDAILDPAMLTELNSMGLDFGLSQEEVRAVCPGVFDSTGNLWR